MTGAEIAELIDLINGSYPNAHPITPLALPAWTEDLADVDTQQAAAAFTAWRRQGHDWPPTSGALRAAARELEDPGWTFEQVWAYVWRLIGRWGYASEREALAELEADYGESALALVAAMGGWQCICQGGPDPSRPVDPGVWLSQARNAWREAQAQRQADRAIGSLPGPRGDAARRRLGGSQSVRELLLGSQR